QIFATIIRIAAFSGLFSTVFALYGVSDYCTGKNYSSQPIKFYYSKEHDLCYGFREGCQLVSTSIIYDDLQSCIDQNFSPGTVKFVELTCALRALGVVVDKHEMPLLTDLCINEPGSKFCPPYTFCHQSMRYNYSFCCGRGLPNNSIFLQLYAKNETVKSYSNDYYY
uniref:Uncharacterized protein n=1 Tax=Parascaris univalens TaxID=6257 RepID=A0A915AE57_PARUN